MVVVVVEEDSRMDWNKSPDLEVLLQQSVCARASWNGMIRPALAATDE